MSTLSRGFYALLRRAERYTKTDMVYLARNGSWLIAGQFAAAAISFGIAVVFGHLASQDTYGNYKYVLTMAGLLSALSLSGLPTAITQAVGNGRDGALRQGMRLSLQYSFPLVIAGLAFASYEYWIAHNAFLALSFLLISIFTPFLNSYSLFDSFLVGRKDFKRETIYGTLDLLFPAILIFGTLFATKRAILLVLVYFVANTIAAAWFYSRSLALARNNETDPAMLGYGKHLSVMNIIGTLADRIDSIAVFYFLGPAALAVYSFAVAMPEQLKGIMKLAAPLALPRFVERTFAEIRATMTRRILLFTLLIFIAVAAYVAVAPFLFKVFFPLYMASVPYSQIYAISILLNGVTIPIITALQAHKRTRALYLATNTGSAVLVVISPALTYFFGIAGAIAGQIVYRSANAGFALWQYMVAKDV